MVASVEVLSALPDNHPERAKLLDILKRHIDGVKAVQPESGVWHQILNNEKLWEETSCTAMFAYSIARAVNRGWINASYLPVARKAFEGLCAQYITPTGVVKGTCEGTNIGIDYEYYAMRPRPDDDHHAPGVVLLAGSELLAAKK
jgi:rhamnogalacturonyl hydrolase YesR